MDRLYRLDRQCFPPEIAYGRAELESFVRHPSGWTAVVEQVGLFGAELLGFAVVRTLRGRMHLVTIDVAPAARRRGVGRRLMDWAEQRAVSLHLPAMRLEVAVTNEAARAFYTQLGFAEVGRLPAYYPPNIDALVLERPVPVTADLK